MKLLFETSGVVRRLNDLGGETRTRPFAWSDLSPFMRGYVEALFAQLDRERPQDPNCPDRALAFSDLAPETLARIMEDCERYAYECPRHASEHGGMFWTRRQRCEWPTFPPLTPYPGEDGKVYLKDPA